jgi:hypothetical protein
LIAYNLGTIQTPVSASFPGSITGGINPPAAPPIYLLENASISMKEEGVTADASFISDTRGAFLPRYIGGDTDFIARTVKWYDCAVFISNEHFNQQFQLKSLDVKFDVDIEKNYFIGTSQYPFFAIKGYSCSGSMDIVMSPLQYENFLSATNGYGYVLPQTPGVLAASRARPEASARQFEMRLGHPGNYEIISFGNSYMTSGVKRSMSSGQLTLVNISFKNYIHSGTPINYELRRV